MVQAYVIRLSSSDKQTLGTFQMFHDVDKIFECKTLELPWLNNQRNISCIPIGSYRVTRRYSPSRGQHFLINDVPGRSYILIHAGNYHTDILGCILVGQAHLDINRDGYRDVTSSRKTMQLLNRVAPDEFMLNIV